MKTAFFISVVFFIVTSGRLSFSQYDSIQQNLSSDTKVKTQTIIFNNLESGILMNDVKKISKYLSPQPYIS